MNKAKSILMLLMMMTLLLVSSAGAETRRVGVLLAPGAQEKIAHRQAEHAVAVEYTYYDNLASALLGLQRGQVDVFGSEGAAAEYIVLRHENMAMTSPSDRLQIDYAMMTMTDKQDIFNILDGALREMKADGTIDRLIENELRAYIETDAEPKDLPHFDGAQTIRIAVTGDVPPMDFITASGKPAGFNIALLSEIANRAKVNFELIQMDGGARPLALATGKIDASFWTRSVSCVDCNVTWNEAIAHTMVTESYLSQPAIDILMKTEEK